MEAFQAATLSMCTMHNVQLKFAIKVTPTLAGSHLLPPLLPLYVSPSPFALQEIDCKNLLVKNMKNYWQPKKSCVEARRNASSKWKLLFLRPCSPPLFTPYSRSNFWSALWPWTGNATMLKLLSRVENVQQIVWPRFQEQLTVIRAVWAVWRSKFTATPPAHFHNNRIKIHKKVNTIKFLQVWERETEFKLATAVAAAA